MDYDGTVSHKYHLVHRILTIEQLSAKFKKLLPPFLNTHLHERLPSWTPDWRVWTDDADNMFLGKINHFPYRASGDSKPEIVSDAINSGVLKVSGIRLDIVHSTSPRKVLPTDDAIPYMVKQDWDTWKKFCDSSNFSEDLATQALAFEKSLFLGINSETITKPTMTRLLLRKVNNEVDPFPDIPDNTTTADLVDGYFNEDMGDGNACANIMRFLVTTNGLMGRGPLLVRPGDVIVVLLGARVPFVLRRFESRFILLGQCCQ
jgi:hypothetical protein